MADTSLGSAALLSAAANGWIWEKFSAAIRQNDHVADRLSPSICMRIRPSLGGQIQAGF